ncbi:hypothetical protein EWM62_06750 [Mucilaginibacter terrigena]|uniref:Uncharacterized protein n=1 Tax=Mucilaginibacter terrigena TaxID=2492395 RepID=A0A4Q5LQC6_9SPHI|nr:hypothetical protein [Mucilaginibacter terrigena]RYU91632.1 hypothetical protein EWM62_06750 [Mucilaginibacter terrigena]
MSPLSIFAQIKSFEEVKDQVLNKLTDPDLLNSTMAKYMAALKGKDTTAYNYVRDLNLKFKTFQAGNQPPGLGFSYQYDNSWTKNSIGNGHDFSQSFNLDLNGNIAFKKVYNPANFLESKFVYNGTFFWGGLAKKNTKAQADQLRALKLERSDAIASGDAGKREAIEAEAAKLTHITDQFYLGINGSTSFESNQDFSKTQFVPGIIINAGASSFQKNSTLSWLNLPDYPFALLRWITNTDDHFAVSGVAFPAALFGLDYVVPTNDSLRRAVTGKLDPFTRLRFEVSFKTQAAGVAGQVFWFSANYRWYHQLNAAQSIRTAGIDQSNYVVCALTSSSGLFVSYSYGKLPFDRKNEAVYGLGFKYDLGNWNNK